MYVCMYVCMYACMYVCVCMVDSLKRNFSSRSSPYIYIYIYCRTVYGSPIFINEKVPSINEHVDKIRPIAMKCT